ncbi:MAG: hypothetical protein KatS3mg102_0253 [Planctomycetota bacterium]|nr:MAG: hypothetical protein KatS3mg102_0253 [Planctomycetota bacterium]
MRTATGVVDGSTDEFVEILNLTDDYLDLSELVITELSGSGSESAWFVLPGTAGSAPALGALLPPRRALVVFGGLNAGQSIDERALALGFSKYLLAGRPQGTSNARFNNPPTGDWVRLRLPSPSGPTAGDELSGMNFRPGSNGSTPSNDQSENRLPDATSGLNNITGHLNLNPAIPHSAGRRADGRPFD